MQADPSCGVVGSLLIILLLLIVALAVGIEGSIVHVEAQWAGVAAEPARFGCRDLLRF